MIQRGEIVEATAAEYGWAVKPNKHSRFENFWVTIGTELQVTHVRTDGMLNVRFAAVGMDRALADAHATIEDLQAQLEQAHAEIASPWWRRWAS